MQDRIDEREEVVVDKDGEHIREVRVREDHVAQRNESVGKVTQLIYLGASALEFLIGLRVLLRAVAANPNNPFASFIYNFSELFVWPFNGLTITPGFEGFVLDAPAIVAMAVYAALAWVFIQLVWIMFNRRHTNRITTYRRD